VVVGGGSPICASKGAALEVTNEVADVRSFEGRNQFKRPPLPVICLPTTAGSGSDVVEGFPVVDRLKRRHFAISGDRAAPVASILDPVLLKTCPRRPMVYAEIDALSHALEALWGKRSTILSDALAYEAIRLIMTNVKDATFTDNLNARTNQHLGSSLGMIAASHSGLGMVHAFAGLIFSAGGPHGYKCGLFLPLAMEFNLPVCQEKFATMATILGETSQGRTNGELAGLFIRRVKQLLIDLDFPRQFKADGLSKEQIPAIIEEIKGNTPLFIENNLRRMTDEDVVYILGRSLEGWNLD
jgi:lactaldehyde reductase